MPQGAQSPSLPVLFLNAATLPPLGADTWIHAQIMANLDQSRYELHAACVPQRAGQPTPTFEALRRVPGLRVRPVNLGPESSGRSALGRLRRAISALPAIGSVLGLALYVRRHRIRIVHTSDRPRDAFAAVLVARLGGARCVIHAHVAYGQWMGRLLKWSLRRTDALVAVSQFVARSLVESGHRPDRIHVVLNAIEPRSWTPGRDRAAARHELGLRADAPVVVTVCRLFPEKGPGLLIEAMARVVKELPDAHLVIVGSDVTAGQRYRDELVGLVRDFGLETNVTFTGRRPDVERMMGAADVFAMPSFEEPFGLVFLEAMAMELPVVALYSGGAPEVVEHGRTGFLSPPGSVDELAEHLVALLKDPVRRAQMGVDGRRTLEERFTTERLGRDTAQVYELVAS